MKKKMLSAILAAALGTVSLSGGVLAAETANFSDVEGHWAKAAIEWGVGQGAVSGYDDGTFKPDKNVTEEEFLSMFLRAFKNDLPKSADDWSAPAYSFAKENNYPAAGLTSAEAKGQDLKRKQVAELIAAASGYHLVGNDSIEFLLEAGYSKGKTSATVEGYEGEALLNRAEAIQFIKALKENGFEDLLERPKTKMTMADLEYGGRIMTVLEQLAEAHPDYEFVPDLYNAAIVKGDNELISWYWYTPEWGSWNEIGIYDVSNADSVKLAAEALKAMDIPVGADFAAQVKKAIDAYDTVELTAGDYNIALLPGDVLNQLSIIIEKK